MLSEQWALNYGPSWLAAILLTAAVTLLALFCLRHHPLRQTWPLLLLAGYVGYPQPNPLTAVTVLLLVTAVLSQTTPIPHNILPANRRLVIYAVGSILAFALLYIFTLAPGLLPADNGEFQLVGATLGVAHPPGFPLYTLLSHFMTWLPLAATAAYKINLLSAFTSAATLGLVYLTVFRLTQRHLAAGTAVLALGTATTFWAQATTANIRSLTGLFAALAIYALIRHWQEKAHTDRYLVLFAAALSFGFTHHLSLAFMGLVFGLSLIWIDPAFFKMPRRWGRPFFVALLGLLPLLYLPLRAGADVPGATGVLNTLPGFLNHFLGLGFQGDFFYYLHPAVLWPRLKVMGNVLTLQFSPWLLAGALLGWLWLLRRHWRIGLLLGSAFIIHTLVTATYRAPQTVEYMLPAYLPVTICLGVASGYLTDWGLKRPLPWQALALTGTAVLAAAAVAQGWHNWPSYYWLHQVEDTRDYTQNILDEAPPDSLILANWHWATPLWYLQTVEGQRPDVTIEYVAPPGKATYPELWAHLINTGLMDGRTVIATFIDEAAYATLPPPEPLGEALLFRQSPRMELPASFTPLSLTLHETVQIVGYRLEQSEVEIGLTARVTIAWQGETTTPLFVHLLDETGSIVAQADVQATPQSEGITLTQFHLTPRRGPGNFTLRLGSGSDFAEIGTLPVMLAALPPATQNPVYRPILNDEHGQTLIGYDWDTTLPDETRLYLHWRTDDGYLSTIADSPQAPAVNKALAVWGVPRPFWSIPRAPHTAHYVPLGQGIVWTGRSLADGAAAVSPGQSYDLTMRFVNGRPLLRDYVVSTRLVGYEADNFTWAWCDLVDSIPAMGGIPTLKWIQGSVVYAPRTVIFLPRGEPAHFTGFCQSEKPTPGTPILYVDNAAVAGQTISGLLVVYDAFTNRPLPILDERITAVSSWIPLGEAKIGD
ncbi:MAG: DUF2723 domain-containing protein [Anaerolineaceae bacterium]|nr:DUF2723 domain-containing protein [Anaerolineaceae bacterium]